MTVTAVTVTVTVNAVFVVKPSLTNKRTGRIELLRLQLHQYRVLRRRILRRPWVALSLGEHNRIYKPTARTMSFRARR